MGALIGDGVAITIIIKICTVLVLLLDMFLFAVSFDSLIDMSAKERAIGCGIMFVATPIVIALLSFVGWFLVWFLTLPNFFPGR